MTVNAGVTYSVSFDIRAETDSAALVDFSDVNSDFTEVSIQSVPVTTQYTTQTVSFTPTQSWDSVRLRFQYGNGLDNRYCVDNVTMTEVR